MSESLKIHKSLNGLMKFDRTTLLVVGVNLVEAEITCMFDIIPKSVHSLIIGLHNLMFRNF